MNHRRRRRRPKCEFEKQNTGVTHGSVVCHTVFYWNVTMIDYILINILFFSTSQQGLPKTPRVHDFNQKDECF